VTRGQAKVLRGRARIAALTGLLVALLLLLPIDSRHDRARPSGEDSQDRLTRAIGRTLDCLGPGPAEAQEGFSFDVGAIFGDGCFELEFGMCVCGFPPRPCLKVTYWEPRLAIWTGATAAGKQHGEIALQYDDALAYPFPVGALMELAGFDFVCTPEDLRSMTTFSATAAYSSYLDEAAWRQGGIESLLAGIFAPLTPAVLALCAGNSALAGVDIPGLGNICMGVWGPLFPRTGWLVHPSEPVGSAAAAYRAAHILSHPELLWGRVAIPALDFSASTSDKQNLVVPRTTPCIRPGAVPLAWESGTQATSGHYVWVYWVKRTCCVQFT
jgi:hypothetical protein